MNFLVVWKTEEAKIVIKEQIHDLKGMPEYESHFRILFEMKMTEKGLEVKRKDSGVLGAMIRKLMSDAMVSAYFKSVLQKSLAACDYEVRLVK